MERINEKSTKSNYGEKKMRHKKMTKEKFTEILKEYNFTDEQIKLRAKPSFGLKWCVLSPPSNDLGVSTTWKPQFFIPSLPVTPFKLFSASAPTMIIAAYFFLFS